MLPPAGDDAAADLVRRWLAGDVELVEDDTVDDVTVVTGADWQGLRTEPLPASDADVPTPTTLAPAPIEPEDATTTTALGTVSGSVPDDVVCG